MTCGRERYICGFNGFGQIDEMIYQQKHQQAKESGESTEMTQGIITLAEKETWGSGCRHRPCVTHYESPQKVNVDILQMTWSQIVGINGEDQVTCYGYKSEAATSSLVDNKVHSGACMVSTESDVLLGNHHQSMLMRDGKMLTVKGDTDKCARTVAATRDKFYSISDGKLYEGILEKQNVSMLFQQIVLPGVKISSVACGFEHTVLLSDQGAVYTFGSGSRGQLGHGQVTVDVQIRPGLVETFEGIYVISVSAGGWHSAAVTDSRDVYVWGWNESGQLGLPNDNISGDLVLESDQAPDNQQPTSPSGKPVCVNKEPGENIQALETVCVNYMSNTEPDCLNQENKAESVSISQKSDTKPVFLQQETQTISGGVEADMVNFGEAKDVRVFHQTLGSVQVQTVPYGLELPDEYTVKSVSCGTRHTCVLLENGLLLTTGWNQYGQLCHGDTRSRDFLQTVQYFIDRQETVTDVIAQYWNTFVVTEKR